MRGIWRGGGAVVLAAAIATAGGVAGAAKVKVRSERNVSLIATGSLTYTWNGDAARGCAAVGVCGIHGELILRAQSSGQSGSTGGGPIDIFLDGSAAARVVREEGGAVVGECVDLPGSSFSMLFMNLPTHRAATATIESPPTSGRCAGPTGADLAGVSVPVRRTGRFSFDLTGTRSFAAGPFSGTLVSSLRLVPPPRSSGGGSFSGGFSSSSSGPGAPGRPTTAPLREFVQLQYRVSAAPSAIETQFGGSSQPSCQLLDACGTSGSLAFSVAPSHGLTLVGSRLVGRRLSRRQVLNDVRRGRLPLSAFQLLTGRVSEMFSWPDGSSCRDAVATPSLLLGTRSPGARPAAGQTISVTVSSNGGGPASEVFRTHCPGPADSDLFGENLNGGNQTYARGSITTAQLLTKRSVLTLSDPGSFNGLGYAGSRTGSIILDLTLTKVTAEMQR